MDNFKLKDFYLNEDFTKDINVDDSSKFYDPVNENDEGILKYNTTIDGRKYKVSFDVNKNPTKKGIKVKLMKNQVKHYLIYTKTKLEKVLENIWGVKIQI